MNPEAIASLASPLKPELLKALRAWRSTSHTALLPQLLLVQDQRRRLQADTSLYRLATNTVLLEALDELQQRNEQEALVLRERFLNGESVTAVALQQHMTVDAFKKFQRKAIGQLTYIIAEQELTLRQETIAYQERKLEPASYTRLHGFEQAQAELHARLEQPGAPWMIALTGIGGSGKTAVADAIVRRLVGQLRFDDIGWVEVQQSPLAGSALTATALWEQICTDLCRQFPETRADPSADALRRLAKSRAMLLVIDNLEHREEIDLVVAKFEPMLNPSRVLLTSRARPPASVFSWPLEELSPDDTVALLRHEATITHRVQLASASDETLRQIHQATGGNPLALKLVVGLANTLPLPVILDDLSQARLEATEAMYLRIFLRAWGALSANAQTVLKMMPLIAGTGAVAQQLMDVTQLANGEFWRAITELTDRSLLQIKGTLENRRYSIHRVTEQFLCTQIIHWQV